VTDQSEVVFVGGRSGVGKSAVAVEMSAQLAARDIRHALIEGDNLDMAYPPPWAHGLAERNLASMWRNYLELGYHRLIYTNTNSVCSVEELVAAMGGRPRVVAVLLTATEDKVHDGPSGAVRWGPAGE
jgi:Adenylylsulphate kinase